MGRLFSSFEEAWSDFLAREAPLESFYDGLHDDPGTLLPVWLLEAHPLAAAAANVQAQLAGFDWIVPTPPHFLHVTIQTIPSGQPDELVEHARAAWRALQPFTLDVRRVNCFHDAVVAEVEGDGVQELRRRLDPDVGFYLPHLTLGYFRSAGPPHVLRERLAPLRDHAFGRLEIDSVPLCAVPVARSRFLEPWAVAGTVRLA